jgi:hypothetical protein
MNELKSLTLGGKKYDSFPDQEARDSIQDLLDNPPGGTPGKDGKSAYAYAQDGGYTGSETEFAAKLALDVPTDSHINDLINTALGVIENGTY